MALRVYDWVVAVKVSVILLRNTETLKKKDFYSNSIIMIKKKILHFCFMLFALMDISCEQRNPQAEYELLRVTVYESPKEGVEVANEYIDHFQNNKKARITEVSEIRSQYMRMNAFFSNSYSSYGDYMTASRELNYELSYSNYDGVRRTWLSLYERQRKRLLAPIMDSITESEFDRFFQEDARKISGSKYPSWNVESIEKISMTTPILEYSGMAKKALGEYRVRLSGKRTGFPESARFSVEGTLGPDESGNIIYTRKECKEYEKPFIR